MQQVNNISIAFQSFLVAVAKPQSMYFALHESLVPERFGKVRLSAKQNVAIRKSDKVASEEEGNRNRRGEMPISLCCD